MKQFSERLSGNRAAPGEKRGGKNVTEKEFHYNNTIFNTKCLKNGRIVKYIMSGKWYCNLGNKF